MALPEFTMRQLLEAGVHFGHQTHRWNPKMKPYIFGDRNGVHILDLSQTVPLFARALEFISSSVASGGKVLFVGTKRQAQEPIAQATRAAGQHYVNHRWLGGMLTNFSTVAKRVARMRELDQIDFDNVAASGLTKKELLMMRREKEKLELVLSGIRDMSKLPSAIWVVDTNKEHIAVGEARKLGIPVVGILDTNCDPDVVDYPIPGNDDALRAVGLLTKIVSDAVAEGLIARSGAAEAGKAGDAEPLAEWETELLAGSTDAATPEVAPAQAAAE